MFLLFLAPLFGPRTRFGYVDDVAVYCSSQSPQQAGQLTADETDRYIHWLKQNRVPVNPSKTKFLRLTKGPKLDSTPVRLEKHSQPLQPAANVQYLKG